MIQKQFNYITVSELPIAYANYDDIVSYVDTCLRNKMYDITIGYVNANSIVLSHQLSRYRQVLTQFSLLYAEGTGMHLASLVLGNASYFEQKNNNATDCNFALLTYANHNKLRVYFIGAEEMSIRYLEDIISRNYPDIKIVGASNGFTDADDPAIIDRIGKAKPDIIFVGMGSPKQEMWLEKKIHTLKIPVWVTVGAFFDFVSGNIHRAPNIVRRLHLEWLFRLIHEPRRLFKRYIYGIPLFAYYIFKQAYTKR